MAEMPISVIYVSDYKNYTKNHKFITTYIQINILIQSGFKKKDICSLQLHVYS